MKIKITENYFDKQLNRRVEAGEVLDVDKKRAAALNEANVAAAPAGETETAAEETTTAAAEETPKPKRTKK